VRPSRVEAIAALGSTPKFTDPRSRRTTILTRPGLYRRRAEPGDNPEIRILKIDLAIPYAYNGFRYGAGILSDDFTLCADQDHPCSTGRGWWANFAPRRDRG